MTAKPILELVKTDLVQKKLLHRQSSGVIRRAGCVERLLAHNTSEPCKKAIKLLGAAPTDFVLELHGAEAYA